MVGTEVENGDRGRTAASVVVGITKWINVGQGPVPALC